MSAIVAALTAGKPIPVAVVADQQDLAQQDKAENEIEVTTNEPRKRQRELMRALMDLED